MDGNPNRSDGAGAGTMDLGYLKTIPGILKLSEILCLLIAFASLAEFTKSFKDDKHGGRYDFFFFATVTSWLLVIIIFIVFLMRLYEKFTGINWNLLLSVYSVVTAFLLLISSALVLDNAVFYRRHEKKNHGIYASICQHATCGNVEAAGVFAMFSVLLFLADTVFFCVQNRRSGQIPPPGATPIEQEQDVE